MVFFFGFICNMYSDGIGNARLDAILMVVLYVRGKHLFK